MQLIRRVTVPGWFTHPAFGVCTAHLLLAGLTWALLPFASAGIAGTASLLYLLLTLVAAATWGYLVGISAAVVADLLVNYFFVEPRQHWAK